MLRTVTAAVAVALACTLISCTSEDLESSENADQPPTQPIDSSFAPDRTGWPDPPQIPADFSWVGRYVVPDLGIEVPFTWQGSGGDFQMIAGDEDQPIHFTNLIHEGELYTLTYEWPGIPRMPCSHVGAFTLGELNEGFAEALLVGRETLHRESRSDDSSTTSPGSNFTGDFEVNHFRSVGVVDLPSELLSGGSDEIPLRLPIMAGDIYVDVDNSQQIRQLLHFGLQNLYDPNLDEWILIDDALDEAGEVLLPAECVIS